MKARHGVRVAGAEARNSSAFKITLDLNHKLHGAMVTAFVADKKTVHKSDRYGGCVFKQSSLVPLYTVDLLLKVVVCLTRKHVSNTRPAGRTRPTNPLFAAGGASKVFR